MVSISVLGLFYLICLFLLAFLSSKLKRGLPDYLTSFKYKNAGKGDYENKNVSAYICVFNCRP